MVQSQLLIKFLQSWLRRLLRITSCQCLRVTAENSWNKSTIKWQEWLCRMQASSSSMVPKMAQDLSMESLSSLKSFILSSILCVSKSIALTRHLRKPSTNETATSLRWTRLTKNTALRSKKSKLKRERSWRCVSLTTRQSSSASKS